MRRLSNMSMSRTLKREDQDSFHSDGGSIVGGTRGDELVDPCASAEILACEGLTSVRSQLGSWAFSTPDNSPIYEGGVGLERTYCAVDTLAPVSVQSGAHVAPPKAKEFLALEVRTRSSSSQASLPTLSPAGSREPFQHCVADRPETHPLCITGSSVSREDIADLCTPFFQKMITAIDSAVRMRLDIGESTHSITVPASASRTGISIPETIQEAAERFPTLQKNIRTTNVCCHWKNKGHCWYQNRCKFLHPAEQRGSGKQGIAPHWVSSGCNSGLAKTTSGVSGRSQVASISQ